MPDVKMYSVNK